MGWRSVLLSQAARLSLKDCQLRIEQETKAPISLPLEDLAVIVLESSQVLVTSALLNRLPELDVALVTCDASHLPNGVLLPFLPHSRSLKVMEQQMALTVPQKKRAWQTVVRQKLTNQGRLLNTVHPKTGPYLFRLAANVGSGDPDNNEGTGARYYFQTLFGKGFKREKDCWTNKALNYGYAIIRAAVARSLVGHGFLPVFGLHHHSQLNSFNLVDDFLEPLRPMVDALVIVLAETEATELTTEVKAKLVQLLHVDVAMRTGTMSILAATDAMVESFGRYTENGDCDVLDLPTFPGKNHEQGD